MSLDRVGDATLNQIGKISVTGLDPEESDRLMGEAESSFADSAALLETLAKAFPTPDACLDVVYPLCRRALVLAAMNRFETSDRTIAQARTWLDRGERAAPGYARVAERRGVLEQTRQVAARLRPPAPPE